MNCAKVLSEENAGFGGCCMELYALYENEMILRINKKKIFRNLVVNFNKYNINISNSIWNDIDLHESQMILNPSWWKFDENFRINK